MASPSPPCPCNCRSHVTNTPTPSPSPSSSVPKIPSNRNSIEQVWKDINLATLCNCSTDTEAAPPSTFLNVLGPLNNDSSTILLSAADSSLFQKQAPSTNNSLKQGLQDYSLLLSLDTSKSSSTNLCSSDQRLKRLMKNRESAARSRARKQAYNYEMELKLARLVEENSRLTRQVEQLQLQLCLQKSSAKPSKMRTLYRTSTCPF